MANTFALSHRIKSFGYALHGLRFLWREEAHFRIHLLAAVLVIVAGFMLTISTVEWCIVIICIAGVMAAEGVNTCLENMCNLVTEEYNPRIKKIKDMAAAVVLIVSVGASIAGCVIFIPKIYLLCTIF